MMHCRNKPRDLFPAAVAAIILGPDATYTRIYTAAYPGAQRRDPELSGALGSTRETFSLNHLFHTIFIDYRIDVTMAYFNGQWICILHK
jgi:hypothetical protein